MKWRYLLVILSVILCVSCYDEGDLAPTEGTEEIFKLPQGDHDYDTKIVEWFKQYGFYALYIFDEKDIYWANENWLEGGVPEISTAGTEKGKQGDPEYVGYLVDMLEKLFINHYPTDLLQKGMPLRVFLCSELWDYSRDYIYDDEGNYLDYDYVYHRIWMYEGWDNIAINGASAYITDTLTREGQVDFSGELNAYFLKRLADMELISIPDEFYEESEYSTESMYGTELFENGYLQLADSRSDVEEYKKFDLETYLELATYSLDYLENGELEEIGSYDDVPSLSGLFRRPESTKVKKKYDIIIKVLRDAGIKLDDIRTPPVVEY